MAYRLTQKAAPQFVAAVAKVEEGQDLKGCGLCSAIFYAGCNEAYDGMDAVVGSISYDMPGFQAGVWTEERSALLATLQALSVDDVWELMQQWNREKQ